MSMGSLANIEDIGFMQSFFSGDSMYVFIKNEMIAGPDGPTMLHMDACAYMMTVFARFWFEDLEAAKAYLDANYEEHWFEKKARELKEAAEAATEEESDDDSSS